MPHVAIFAIILVAVISIIEVLGDFLIKLSGQGAKYIDWKLFIPGFAIYSFTAILWFFAIKNEKLSTLGVFFSIFTILCFVAIDVFYFKEQMNSYEIVGIILALISLVLLGRFA